jgi:serpin B
MWRIAVCFVFLLSFSIIGCAEVPPADRAAVVKGNTQFALELYAKLRQQEGNLFLSPYSISTALAMTYGGARGQTADEMARTLHFDLPGEKLHPAFGALLQEVNGPGDKKRGYQLTTANALWGQKGYPFHADFLKLNKDSYGAGLNDVDFIGNTEMARQTINTWVEKQTHDKIKDLLKEGVLTRDTRMVLTNAIYFKGDWFSQFKKDATRDESFFVTADKQVKAPLMHQKGQFNYHETDSFQALELPYVGKELSMVVLLPKKKDGLGELEKSLSVASLGDTLRGLRLSEVVVTLPKFKVTAEFSLRKTLSELGMATAFGAGADFSGIASKEGLKLADVVHKAFVDVNEEGTEAAAATAVILEAKSKKVIPEFRADHPFLFLIRDMRSDSILFLGRLVEPQ